MLSVLLHAAERSDGCFLVFCLLTRDLCGNPFKIPQLTPEVMFSASPSAYPM